MLTRLLDSAGFQSAANMSPDDFANAAMAGMVPRAIGTLANVPLWQEHIVQTFCKEAGREFNDQWSNGGGAASASALLVSSLACAGSPVVEVAEPDYPDEMSQVYASRYCECSAAFLEKHTQSGLLNSRKDGGFVIYRKADLDAFKQLAVYRYRKRKGYTAGKPNGKPQIGFVPTPKAVPVPVEQKMATTGVALLSERGAADHLGIHPDALAIARKDGIGPPCSMAGGTPHYRVADLDAWKSEAKDKTPTVKAAQIAVVELDPFKAAEYLGVTRQTMQWWRNNGTGPAFRKESDNRAAHIFYTVEALEQFKRTHQHSITHSQKMRANPNVAGPHASRGKSASTAAKKKKLNGTAQRPNGTRTHAAGVKATTPNGSRLRH